MEKFLHLVKKIIPSPIFSFSQPVYHYLLAIIGAVVYRFPSRKIKVIAVTGTKGKSSVVEILAAILEEPGYKVASASTIRFKIGSEIRPNLFKMTMPGRFFIQRFLRRAVDAGCQFALIEVTSEAARQFRHKFIDFDALIFTNLQKEHLESHGSYEKYRDAKLKIAHALGHSPKSPKFMIANADDREAGKFFEIAHNTKKVPFSLKNAEPFALKENGLEFNLEGTVIKSPLIGQFNIYNLLAAASCAKAFGVSNEKIKKAIENIRLIPGRAEIIKGKNFDVVVDYAHTPDSLKAIYEAFGERYKICVLGNTGGGRDTWKRPEMAKISNQYCNEIILTNEDPYDENPQKIVQEMSVAIEKSKLTIEIERRVAIRMAIKKAAAYGENAAVLITGKGTDPFIMGANGSKQSWSDANTTREELEKYSKSRI